MDVSFIVTCYNYSQYVVEAIDSCINQKDTRLSSEVIVIDDGSSDGSKEIIETHFSDVVRLFSIKNSGVERASNLGARFANGTYLTRLDADDVLADTYLKNIEKKIIEGKDIIYTDYWELDENGEQLDLVKLPDFEPNEILERGDFLATGMAIKKLIFYALGQYDETFTNSGLENYALILDALQKNIDFAHVPVPSFKYRLHKKSLSASNVKKIIKNGDIMFTNRNLIGYNFGKYHPWARRR